MTYAIIETGGKQLRVEPGRFYDVERLSANDNDQVTLDQVLFIEHEGEATIGQPRIADATVEATVMRHLRGRKIIVYKMRPKKKTRKKQGHRQELTRLMINSISLNGDCLAGASLDSVSPAVEEPAVKTAAVEVVEEAPVEDTAAAKEAASAED
ncbi:MAG: 50S ribosomal protein L21 [Leptolyngbyaceae cyanobacterium MO_188.B28]|nr:50S ribosomal protein L21 [Leptolyngbyaceae cyanobacterium MO_188.B28]